MVTVAERQISPQKVAVVDALRALAWRWSSFDEICSEAQLRHHPLPRRSVRRRLEGLEVDGWAERSDALLVYSRGYPTWRWRLGATQEAERVAGITFAAVEAEPPRLCLARGHDLSSTGHRFPDGSTACVACAEAVQMEGRWYFQGSA
jgi:hypothetical protein